MANEHERKRKLSYGESFELGRGTPDAEWAKWRQLCQHLLVTGAVTQADLDSPSTERKTPGQETLWLVKEWADLFHRMMRNHESVSENDE